MKEKYYKNALRFESGVIDKATETISNVAVITKGEALGHGGMIDDEFLDGVVTLGNAQPEGVRSRFGHPIMCLETLGTLVGRFFDFYRDGDKVIARRVQFNRTALNTHMIDHIMQLAETDPTIFGTSIACVPQTDERGNEVLKDDNGNICFTISELVAVDFVEQPAANPSGLFKAFGVTDLEGKATQFAKDYPNEAQKIIGLLKIGIADISLQQKKEKTLLQKFHKKSK